ncbi:hypothetical protein HPB52_015572 [Rhipicephalus sanguineus]|uniref:Uncharacterized protein n=1 Tax=Rhipicephalus sanguineus TaxID=34632 RepID=A0A9D4SMZ1_RHISA|nr:hypothetical protein HPB52_015572 [Rhipicephalus sanguineus]
MSDAPKKAAKRLIKWRDSARRQLSTASCSDDLASALQFVLRNVAKTFRAVLLSSDDDQLSRDLNDVLCHVSSHLYLRSRSLLADRSSRFDYWAHQCAVLSYLLDLSLVRDDPGAFTKICFVLSKNKHAVWDVLVQTSAISSASDLQSKLVDLFRRFAAYCPRTCASAELYFKFVVCAACLARRLPERGWKTVKPVVPLDRARGVRLRGMVRRAAGLGRATPSVRGADVSCQRRRATPRRPPKSTVFRIADEEVPEREQDAKVAEVEDEQLQAILDATLSRLQSNFATPHASEAEPNSEVISDISNSPLNTRVFLDRLLRNSAGDTGDGELLKNAESPTKKLGSRQHESVEGVNNSAENEAVTAALAKAHEDESSDEENGVECSAPQKAVPSNSGSSVGHPAQQAKSSDKEVCVKHSATQEESSNEKGSVEDSALQEAEPSDGEGSVDHSTRQDAEFSDKCSVEHPAHPQPGQPAVFSEMADEIPCGQRSPCALSLLDMHLSPPESDKYNSLSPVIQGSHPAAESDADTLEIQSNDEGVASCRQRAPRLSQATTVSVSSQRRSPSPFSKLRERVMSFEEDSDDETDAVDFRRKKTSAALPQSPFKLPLLKKPGTSALCKSVKSKRQDGRCSSDKRNSPSKSQPARRRVRSRGSVSPQVKQVAMSNKWQVSVSDSDSADAATSDIASVSLRSSVVGSSNVSAAKAKDLSPGNKKASTRRNSPRTSLPTNKSSKLPEANKTSELERNGASGLDSDVCQEDENKPLVSGKQTRESPANVEKVVTLKTSLPNRRKDTPRPPPLTSDLALREKATLKLSSSHDSDGASVIVNKESGSSEHSRQNKDSAMQPLESVVSTRRLSARSCARRLVLGQQNEVSDSNSSSTCIDVNGRTVQSIDVASLSTGVERQDDSKNANLTPEKPCAPAKRSSGHLAHRIEASTRPGDLSDNGIEHDAPRKHPCPKSPTEMAISSMIKQKPGIEAVGASTSRTGQLASGSGYGSSPSPIRGKTPAYAVNETGQAKHGVLTRSARRQLSFAIDKTSLSKVGRTTRSSRVVGPDVESCGNSGDTTTKSRLRENIEPPPLKARRRVLQDSINDGDSVSDLLSTQGEEAITEKESENENKGVGSPSPTVTKCPAITVGRLQSNETESAATVSGSRNMPRTRSVTVSLKGREEVQVPSTTCDVSHASKQQLEGSNTGHIAGSSRSPLRTPSKRRRVAEAGANVTPPLETTERDLSQTNDGLGGLTQVPLLRNVNASSDSLSSNEEKEFVCAMRQRTQSLRRLPSRRCSQRNNEEDFVIDVDAMVRSFSDSDDGDPSYEVRETNLDASIARLRRLKVPLYALQEEQSRPQSAASSYKVASTSARRTGRLSLTAIRASQSENSASTQSSRSPRFSPAPTTSSGITDAQSPSSNFCTCQSPSRHTRSFGTGPIGAAMEKQAEQDVQSQFQSNVGAPPVHTDTATSAEKTPVLRRSTRVGTKRDTPAWPTRSNHLTSKVPAAAKGPRHPSKDLDVFTQEQTSRATKRSKNSKMSPLLKTHTEPSDESLNAAEQESVTDKASSAICSTCNRSVNSPSTQDSGTMTDDSYLHDEDAFSDSPRLELPGHLANTVQQVKMQVFQ